MSRSPFNNFRGFDGPGAGFATVRVFQTVASQPSWVLRFAALSAGLTLMAILFVLLVPVVLIGVLAFGVAAGIARVRGWFGGLRRPNGALDGRRNVRVIVHQSE